MIPVTQLRSGTVFKENHNFFQVLKYKHIKLGRGTANIKVKVKNLKTGSLLEKTFISGSKVKQVSLEKKEAQYLYQEKGEYFFMDPATFDQFSLSYENLEEQAKFLKEGVEVKLLVLEGKPLSVELPIKMEFKVIDAPPGVRGDSATNIFKEVTLENGLKVKVPLFIKSDDKIMIDTRSGEYVERV